MRASGGPQAAPLRCGDWERFRDPRATTYRRYCQIQDEAQSFVDGVLHAIDESGYDHQLAADWHAVLAAALPALRYPVHGFYLVSAFLAQKAPTGRITVCALMQTADEIRRIQRLAARMRQLQRLDPAVGADSRRRWREDPAWQPLRQLVERLLVTYDWGEALVALQFAVKPVCDALWMERFALLAGLRGDNGLESLLYSLGEDCRWHRQWSGALLRVLASEGEDNRAQLQAWFEHWLPPALAAAQGLLPLLAAQGEDTTDWLPQIEAAARQHFAAASAAA